MSEWYIDEISSLNKEIEKITGQKDDLLESAEKALVHLRQLYVLTSNPYDMEVAKDTIKLNEAIKKAKGGE